MKNLLGSLLFIVILFVLVWIGSVDRTHPYVHPELETFVEDWKNDVESTGLVWKNSFNRLDSITVLDSFPDQANAYVDFSKRVIYVSEKRLGADPIEIKATVYHELGHWVFLLKHGDCAMLRTTAHKRLEYYEYWEEMLAEYLETCKEHQINSFL
jgi:hypothetical protein